MRGYHLNSGFSHLLVLVLVLIICLSVRTLGDDDPCREAFCGQGTCVPPASGANYACTCNNGWKNDIGLLNLRACVVPNCTLDLECGDIGPPPPPPPPPPPGLPPFIDPLSVCFLVWCNEGTCLGNGKKPTCQCNTGSANLLDIPSYPCFKKCNLGLDCSGLLLSATSPPPNGTLASPPWSPPWSPPNGSDKISKRWSNMVVSLSTIILAWIMYE